MPNLLHPLSMTRMMEHIARELEMTSTVFSVPPGYRGTGLELALPFGKLDLPLGTAPGPHGTLAQNLVCAYVAGARLLSLAPLGVGAPEMAVGSDGLCLRRQRASSMSEEQRAAEAVKAWVMIQLLSRELGLGDGAVLTMALPAQRAFLERPEVLEYIDTMLDASQSEVWKNCIDQAKGTVNRFNNLDREDLDCLDPHISRLARVTAPADGDFSGIELLIHRGVHVVVRFDLSWMETAPGLTRLHPAIDPQRPAAAPLEDALAALAALARRAGEKGVMVGVEASGSLPLSSKEALSGPPFAPFALRLAARMAAAAPELPMSYAGGGDQLDLARLAGVGFQAISVCTTLLKPGGYLRLRQMARTLAALRGAALGGGAAPAGVDPARALALADTLEREPHYQPKNAGPRPRRAGKAPAINCFTAPCQGGCPFGEDIPGALRLMSDGRFRDALQVILDRNPLPHITGAFCHQPCRERCTRLFYDEAVKMNEAETLCADTAWADLLARMEMPQPLVGQRVAVLGGGVAGMATAFLFARRGVPVTLFEGTEQLGGALRRRGVAAVEAIDLDGQLLDVMEIDVRLGVSVPEPAQALKTGYSHVVDARERSEEVRTGDREDQLTLDEGSAEPDGEDDPRIFPLGDGADDVPGAIAQAHRVVDGLLGPAKPCPHPAGRRGGAMGKKGKVWLPGEPGEECHRCLECATVCECCVDVCPNRANAPVTVLTKRDPQIVHLDALCNGCGLCASFCPYEGAPYKDKFTLFETTEAFTKSGNDGFVVLDFLSRKVRLRLGGQVRDASLRHVDLSIPGEIQELMETIFTDYPYLLDPTRRKTDDQVTLWA